MHACVCACAMCWHTQCQMALCLECTLSLSGIMLHPLLLLSLLSLFPTSHLIKIKYVYIRKWDVCWHTRHCVGFTAQQIHSSMSWLMVGEHKRTAKLHNTSLQRGLNLIRFTVFYWDIYFYSFSNFPHAGVWLNTWTERQSSCCNVGLFSFFWTELMIFPHRQPNAECENLALGKSVVLSLIWQAGTNTGENWCPLALKRATVWPQRFFITWK